MICDSHSHESTTAQMKLVKGTPGCVHAIDPAPENPEMHMSQVNSKNVRTVIKAIDFTSRRFTMLLVSCAAIAGNQTIFL